MILTFWAWKMDGSLLSNLQYGERRSGLCKSQFCVDGEIIVNDEIHPIEVYGHGGHACTIHAMPDDEIHPIVKKTYGEIRKRDEDRIQQLETYEYSGKKIQIIEICQFERDYEFKDGEYHQEFRDFLEEYPDYKKRDRMPLTESEVLEKIQKREIQGFVRADFNTPNHLKEMFDLFPLIFRKVYLENRHGGPLVESMLTKLKLHRNPTLELISCHSGTQILVSSELVRLYLDLGIEITNVTLVIQYRFTNTGLFFYI